MAKFLKIKSADKFPVLILDTIIAPRIREQAAHILNFAIVIYFITLIISKAALPFIGLRGAPFVAWFTTPPATGVLLVMLGLRLVLLMWQGFRQDKLYGHKPKITSGRLPKNLANLLDYDCLLAFYYARRQGLHKAMLKSSVFTASLLHLGITAQIYQEWFERQEKNGQPDGQPKRPDKPDEKMIFGHALKNALDKSQNQINITNLINALNQTGLWKKFLFEHNIKPEEAVKAARWAHKNQKEALFRSFWWRKENLSKIPSIGRDWAYGMTPTLERFSRDIMFEASNWAKLYHFIGRKDSVKQIEQALLKNSSANIIIVGEEGVGKRTTLLAFARAVRDRRVPPSLEGKRVVEMDAPSLVSAAKTKAELEGLLIKIFNEASSAGNIIIVLSNMADFIKSASGLDVNLLSVLTPYMESASVNLVSFANMADYRSALEADPVLKKYFEILTVEEPDEKKLFEILTDVSLAIERQYELIATIKGLDTIVEATQRYLTEGGLPERAIDLLEAVFAFVAEQEGRIFITRADVLHVVKQKTKIPLGEIAGEEQELLLKMEDKLHERVVNQEEAIKAVSNALRRARAEIRSPNKPIGSFLFLGPTGVGKTETAKTLAEAYFGDEEAMFRVDMSEYQSADDVKRFIGSAQTREPGFFESKIRQNPFSLVLLDELEKAAPEILNLLLQILDEGFFTNAFGQKVNMRNTIIVATSNAGANVIWEMVQKGEDPSLVHKQVINEIRKKGTFKPELLNRFDAMVVFHPLSKENLKKVARLMLKKLALRLKEKEIELVINDVLVEKLVEVGYSPEFGARPMQRAIQDKIEKYIAEQMIAGLVKRGSRVEFTAETLEKI